MVSLEEQKIRDMLVTIEWVTRVVTPKGSRHLKLRVCATDTGEALEFVLPEQTEEYERFLGNCIATMDVSRGGEFGYVGPAIEIRWVSQIVIPGIVTKDK